MEAALVIKLVIGLVGFAVWAFGKINGSETTPPVASPPPLIRRTRRVRNAPAPAPAVPEPTPPAPVVATHLDTTTLVVSRPARAHARTRFRGAAALRQAIVAREVLGPPLALRPPRF